MDRIGPMGEEPSSGRQRVSRASREEAALMESLEHLEGRLASLHQVFSETILDARINLYANLSHA